MDNLSHSVVGLAAGELIHRSLPREADVSLHRVRRRLLLLACWLASNFPDLDILLSPLLPAPLGYLLHHRGHTHTVLYAIPQALVLAGLMWLLWPTARRLLRESGNARTGFALALLAGFGLHLLMDYLNSYGIHPFHPFDSRWLYGDMVFILEPVFWVTFGVAMAMTLERIVLRFLFVVLLLGAPLYFTVHAFLPWTGFAALCVIAAFLGVLQHRAGVQGRRALVAAFLLGLCFVAGQGFASHRARNEITAQLHARDPAIRVVDVSLSSFPTNPVCWAFVSVESNEAAGMYRLRRGVFSLLPGMMPVGGCPEGFLDGAIPTNGARGIAFAQEVNDSLAQLRNLEECNCHFRAWLRFARAPMFDAESASDLRFSSSPRGNFTTLDFDAFRQKECPKHVPGWDFPRADLLGGVKK
ncbi:MAG TPA: metal-dependent hydrolase [Noviherbaspirillum sp.]|uniref:metal-dependent hydrolase n=1 Tax=Noviherbaspirillum sp. TaxID=1926288 RepID=UPI002B485F9F|nr:metal-dependent hydrolase [Noviherbaspirillum sp.]HJV88269.1 metal-dependent hydrolase [Noviherbaspirillum sp.]